MKLSHFIILLWILVVSVLLIYVNSNDMTPLGYDHGAYRHYMGLIEEYGRAPDMSIQFESFFDPTIKALSLGISRDVTLTWGYALLYILMSLSVFILGKRGNKYTMTSYIGCILVLTSLVQYRVFWVGLGKELFATFLLLVSIKYYKNVWIYTALTAACIGLHRLTGIFSILFMGILFATYHTPWKKKIYMFIAIIVGAITYIPAVDIQIAPLISGDLSRHIFIAGWSGSLFGEKIFWSTQIISLLVLSIGIYIYHKKHKKYPKNTKCYFFIVALTLILARVSGHTRIGAFFDLFLIIYIAQLAPLILKQKYLFLLISLQSLIWGIYTYQNHTPTIAPDELSAIKNIKENMIESKYLLNFNKSYGGWILGYSDLEIDSLYEFRIKKPKTKQDKIFMRDNPDHLCQMLHEKKQTVYIFMGRVEKEIFPEKASCITEIKRFQNGAKLFIYRAR